MPVFSNTVPESNYKANCPGADGSGAFFIMTDTELTRIYQTHFDTIFPKKRLRVEANFYASKTLRHTIELNKHTVFIRISLVIQDAPVDVLQALGTILFLKLFRYKPDKTARQRYQRYVDEHVAPNLPEIKRRISPHYTAAGRYFDLSEIFERINEEWFEGKIKQPRLGWSLTPSYTRLGFYDAERNLLVISRIFDSKKTKPQVLEFLMYHEMLHIIIPAERVNGRRRIHPPVFKEAERRFPEYQKIQQWIQRKRHRL